MNGTKVKTPRCGVFARGVTKTRRNKANENERVFQLCFRKQSLNGCQSRGSANITSIDLLETKGIKWLIECPEEIDESSAPLFLEFTVDGQKYKLVIK